MLGKPTDASSRRERLASFGSVIVAFLASQRLLHVLRMLGLGEASNAAGVSFLTAYPTTHRVILLIVLVMAGVAASLPFRHRPPLAQGVINVLSIVVTFGLLLWSISQYGV